MLKAFFYVMILSSLMLFSSCEKKPEKTQQAVPEEFQKLAKTFESAWNKHDVQALADLWADDGNLITPWTDEYTGKKEIEAHFAKEHTDNMKNSQIALKVEHVRLIDSDIAFVDADMTLSGMILAGESAAPLHDHAVFLLVKKDGGWKILIARPY